MGREGPPLALPRGPEQVRAPVVNSETFALYLRPDSPTLPAREFAPHLDIDPFLPSLSKMLKKLKQQNGTTQLAQPMEMIGGCDDFAVRDSMASLRNPDEQYDADYLLDDIDTILANSRFERLHAFYETPKDNEQFHFSEGVEGEVLEDGDHEVKYSELWSLADAGYDIGMVVHNHYKVAMNSGWDHGAIVQPMRLPDIEEALAIPIEKKGARLAKASLTLCPGFYLLAVATAETLPVMDTETWNNKIAEWSTQIRNAWNNDEAARLEAERQAIFQRTKAHWAAEMNEGIERLTELDGKWRSGQLSAEEETWFFAEKERIARLNDEDLRQRPENQAARMNCLNYTGQASNAALVEIAREVGVKMYYSTDLRKGFDEFSA